MCIYRLLLHCYVIIKYSNYSTNRNLLCRAENNVSYTIFSLLSTHIYIACINEVVVTICLTMHWHQCNTIIIIYDKKKISMFHFKFCIIHLQTVMFLKRFNFLFSFLNPISALLSLPSYIS